MCSTSSCLKKKKVSYCAVKPGLNAWYWQRYQLLLWKVTSFNINVVTFRNWCDHPSYHHFRWLGWAGAAASLRLWLVCWAFLSSLLVEWGACAGLWEIQLDYYCSGENRCWPSVRGCSQHGSRIRCSSPPRNGGCFAGSLLPGVVLSSAHFLWQHITHTHRTGWTIQVSLLGVMCGHLFLPF